MYETYTVYTVLLMKWDIVKSDSIDSNVLSKAHGFASHFFGRNIHVSTQLLHFIKFLVKLCSQSPASCYCLKSSWNYEAIFKFPASSDFNYHLIILMRN